MSLTVLGAGTCASAANPAQDPAEPHVVDVDPADGSAESGPSDTLVTVTFDRDLDQAASSIRVHDASGDVLNGTTSFPLPEQIRFDSSGSYTEAGSPFTVTTVAKGTGSGSESCTHTTTFHIDNSAPSVSITSVTNPISAANKTNVGASGTAEAGARIAVAVADPNPATTNPADATATADAAGLWSVSGINASGLDDGLITFTATATDAAGNSNFDVETSVKDTVGKAPVVLLATDPINAANATAAAASGTTEPGSAVSVVFANGAASTEPRNAAVNPFGEWSVAGVDTTSLPDGTVTVTATATDAAGNAGQSSKSVTKDTTPPAISITTAPNINGANAGSVEVTGSAESGANVTVTIADAIRQTDPRQAIAVSGTWSASLIDARKLDDGEVTYTAVARDAAGNTATRTRTAQKDATTFVVIQSATTPIGSLNKLTAQASGVTEPGLIVRLVVADLNPLTSDVTRQTTADATTGAWTMTDLNLSTLDDGPITYTASVTDLVGNTDSDTFDAAKDTVVAAPTFSNATDPINAANAGAVSASGRGEAGSTVSVRLGDGTNSTEPVAATVDPFGGWTVSGIDARGLQDGPAVTYTATATDAAGNMASATRAAVKDTVAPAVTIDSVTDPVNFAGQAATSAAGTAPALAAVDLTVTDGQITTPKKTIVAGADGAWSAADVNVAVLRDGTITYSASVKDSAGNVGTDSIQSRKDTAQSAFVTSIPADQAAVNSAPSVKFTFNEPLAPSSTVTVRNKLGSELLPALSFEDEGRTIVFTPASPFTTSGSPYTATASVRDVAGNPSDPLFTTKTISFSIDTTPPVVGVSTVSDPVTSANHRSAQAAGTSEIGVAGVAVVATDGTNTTSPVHAIVNPFGDWTATGIDVSSLLDGTITYRATASDRAGNTATATKTALKDAIAEVAILQATSPVTNLNETSASASGTSAPGSTVAVSITNGTLTTVPKQATMQPNGNWSASGFDISSFDDGAITYRATATDTRGNTGSATFDSLKNTITNVAILTATNPVNAQNYRSAAASGTTEPGASVKVSAAGGNASIPTIDAAVDVDGNWTVANIDLSSLPEGPLSYTATATDPEGNVDNATRNATKDTVAPSVSLLSVTQPIARGNEKKVVASGTAEPGSTVEVTATDGTATVGAVQATVGGDGTWEAKDIDVSSLKNGTLTFSATARDFAGNTTTHTRQVVKETLPPLEVKSLSPAGIGQTAYKKDVTVAGVSFLDGATVSVSGTGVAVDKVTRQSPSSLLATVTVGDHAAVGPRDVTVTNPDGEKVTCTGCLSVTAGKRFYFSWYDGAHVPADWVLVANTGSSPVDARVRIPNPTDGSPIDLGTTVAVGKTWTPQFIGVKGGPVIVTLAGDGLATMRSLWGSGAAQNFEEVVGTSDAGLRTEHYWPWYDGKTTKGADWVHVSNVGTSDSTVTVKVAGTEVAGSTIQPGRNWYFASSTLAGGPVVVTATQPVMASQRVLWSGVNFSETPGMLTTQDTWFSWYDAVGSNGENWIAVANPGASTANVTIQVGSNQPVSKAVAAGASWAPSFPGVTGGPVHVTSTAPIVVSQRAIWGGLSMEEVGGTTPSAGGFLSWYDNVHTNGRDWVLIANVGSSPTAVTVTIAGEQKYSKTLAAGEIVTPQFAGVVNGPVEVKGAAGSQLISSRRSLWGERADFTELLVTP